MTATPGKAKARPKTATRQSDSHLVEQCLAGNEAAWTALIDRYKNLIFSVPLRYGFAEEDSADIFQAVCMDLLAELPHVREPQALAAWLIQVTRNKCFHRKKDVARHNVQPIDDHEPAAVLQEPADLISDTEKEQLLREALADISPQCRDLVRMLFFEMPPRPYEEVAKQLRMAQGSIGFTRRNCLDKLRAKLEKLGY